MINQQWLLSILGEARNRAIQTTAALAGCLGRRCLDSRNTRNILNGLGSHADNYGVINLDSSISGVAIEIMNSGVVRLDRKNCLDLDYGSRGAMCGWLGKTAETDHSAVLWSHHWMGYYHWLIDVAPKILAIQNSLGKDAKEVHWVYPRSGGAYEAETLAMLEIPDSHIIDSRKYRSIRSGVISMVALPGWFEIQPAAALLRDRLLPFGASGAGKRIYLKRRGRRICLNEDEVVRFLTAKGFVMVEDVSRSVASQIGIFRDAEVVIAPHGAALSNLLWCSPGTKVIECFAKGYCPVYYRNLARFGALEYACVGQSDQAHWTGVSNNIVIDIKELASRMNELDIH